MKLAKISFVHVAVLLSLFLGACTTAQKVTAPAPAPAPAPVAEGDAYTGTDTVKFLADGVPDRVFFSTNKFNLTTAAVNSLNKQTAFLKANANLNVTIEGHADERGTREYNLALGEKRANVVKDYLISNGIASNRIKVVSYGKERPANPASSALAWSQNRRSVTVRPN